MMNGCRTLLFIRGIVFGIGSYSHSLKFLIGLFLLLSLPFSITPATRPLTDERAGVAYGAQAFPAAMYNYKAPLKHTDAPSSPAQRVFWFLGRKFTAHEWSHVKDVIKCWGSKGFWELNPSIEKAFSGMSLAQFSAHIQDVSPCFNPLIPSFYGRSNMCFWILDTDSMRYEWRLAPGSCHGFDAFQQFSIDRMCEILTMSNPHLTHVPTDASPACTGGGGGGGGDNDDGCAGAVSSRSGVSVSSGVQNVMIVGDSMNEQLSLALRSISYRGKGMPKPTTSLCNTYKPMRAFRFPCAAANDSQAVRLYTRRNDRLSFINHTIYDKRANMHEGDWFSQLGALNISLLLLNRGAHYVPDDVLLAEINTTMWQLQMQYPYISIIWRNTPHGHLSYQRHLGGPPLLQPPPQSELSKYNYNSFARQNTLVERLLSEHYPHVLFMDVFTSTVLRADGHYDPLHYCQPGPVYNWVYLLLNIITLVDDFHRITRAKKAELRGNDTIS